MREALLFFCGEVRVALVRLETSLREEEASTTEINPSAILGQIDPASPPKGLWCACGHRESEHDENGCAGCRRDKSMGVIGCPGFAKAARKRVKENGSFTQPIGKQSLVQTIDGLGKMEGKFLWTILQHGPRGVDSLLAFTGYRQSGTVGQTLARMKGSLLTGGPILAATEAAKEKYQPQVPRLPPKGERRREWFIARLNPMETSIIEVLLDHGDCTASVAAERAGYQNSGTFGQAVARLRKLGLLKPDRGVLSLSEEIR